MLFLLGFIAGGIVTFLTLFMLAKGHYDDEV